MLRPAGGAAALAVLGAACGPPGTWIGLSPDHRTAYEVFARDGMACVALDAQEQGCWDAVALHHVTFSADSRHFAYPARQDGRWVVVRDGRAGEPVDAVGSLAFDPSGDRLAYTAAVDGAWRVVVDGERGIAFDSLFAESLVFDPMGRRLAYAAESAGGAVVVVDGRIGQPWEGVGSLQFSPDGRRVAHLARRGDRVALVIDGRVRAEHDRIHEFSLGSDEAAAWIATDAGETRVHRTGEAIGPFEDAWALSLHGVDPAPTFVARDSAGERVVHRSRPGPTFEHVDPPAFDSNGARWGYVGQRDSVSVVVLDGRPHAEEVWATGLVLSPDGRRYAYVAERGGLVYVVHDRGERGFDVVLPGTIVFLRDGRWACLAGDLARRRLFVALEGTEHTRPFVWSELGQLVHGAASGAPVGVPEEQLRRWVATEAALLALDLPR